MQIAHEFLAQSFQHVAQLHAEIARLQQEIVRLTQAQVRLSKHAIEVQTLSPSNGTAAALDEAAAVGGED